MKKFKIDKLCQVILWMVLAIVAFSSNYIIIQALFLIVFGLHLKIIFFGETDDSDKDSVKS